MKALVWDDGHGREVGGHRHPRRHARERRALAPRAGRRAVELRRQHHREVRRRRGDHRRRPPPALRAGTIANQVVPVLCGSAFKNKGVQPMLDAVVDFLPSPLDIPPTKGIDLKGIEELERPADDSEPFSALAFKIMTDPHVGKLTYFRVYSGKLDKGGAVLNSTKDRKERIGRILQMHANHREDKDAGLRRRHRRRRRPQADHHRRHALRPQRPDRPRVARLPRARDPRGRRAQDQGRPGQAGQGPLRPCPRRTRPSRSTPTRRPARRSSPAWASSTSRCLVDRMLREFKVDANVGKPQVAYRETITKTVEKVEERYIRQTGGRGQYGHVVIDLEPTGPGGGYEFVDKITGGVIPKEYIPSVDAGIQEAMQSRRARRLPDGRRPGHPHLRLVPRRRLVGDGVQDRRLDGRQEGGPPGQARPARADHGRRGRDARGLHGRRHRRPVQPARQGRGHGAAGHSQVIRAQVPLAEMFGYATDLRSRTQGRATYTMQFHSYQQVPESIAEEIVARVAWRVARQVPENARRPGQPAPARRKTWRSRSSSGQAPSQHRHDGPHRPRQDDADGGHHQGAGRRDNPARRPSRRSTRSTRRRRRRRAASPSTSPTSSTRRPTATTPTSTCPATPTTSRT